MLVRAARIERSGSEHDVGQRLGQHPADAEHDGRPELWIADQADDQLTVAAHHRCDEHGDIAVVARRSQQFGCRAFDRRARRRGGAERGPVRSCGRSCRRSAWRRPETRCARPQRPRRPRSPRTPRRRAARRSVASNSFDARSDRVVEPLSTRRSVRIVEVFRSAFVERSVVFAIDQTVPARGGLRWHQSRRSRRITSWPRRLVPG